MAETNMASANGPAASAHAAMDTYFGTPIELPLLMDSVTGSNEVAGRIGMQHYWEDWPARDGYVLITHFGEKRNRLAGLLDPVHKRSLSEIYRAHGNNR